MRTTERRLLEPIHDGIMVKCDRHTRRNQALFIWCICGLGGLGLDVVDHTQSALRCGALTWECLFKFGKPVHWVAPVVFGALCFVLGTFVVGWNALNA